MGRFGTISAALWRACSFVARTGIALAPRTRHQRTAIERLRKEVRRAAGATGDALRTSSWAERQRRLGQLILSADARAFLTWSIIRETMFPAPYVSFARIELRALQQSGNWKYWRSVIRESLAGTPLPCLYYPFSTSNTIHQAYHLFRFETVTARRIQDFGTIFEFGAGYGCLCRVAHRLGFRGRYLIFDLPEQCAVQRYYLESVGISDALIYSDLDGLQAALSCPSPGPKLFLALWSLSETPPEFRERIAQAVLSFDAFLIAFQKHFEQVNNFQSFAEWQSEFPTVNWTILEISHLPGNTYLLGVVPRRSHSV